MLLNSPARTQFRIILELFLVSFLALFFEVLFIRWVPASVQIMAFFSNLVLMAAFLGLGIGCLLGKMTFDLKPFLPFLLLSLILVILGFKHVDVSADAVQGEIFRGFYTSQGYNFLLVVATLLIFLVVFFIPLGQAMGGLFRELPPLVAYSWNILGSLCGVVTFAILSYFQFPPVYWFLLALPILLFICIRPVRYSLGNVLLLSLVVWVVGGMDTASFWSPYHKVDILPIQAKKNSASSQDYFISINNTHLQCAFDLSSDKVARERGHGHYKAIYEFPYEMFSPGSVLVLGAGSGNDVAAALRRGAKKVDAVEIDPFISTMGTGLHPEFPYRSPRVQVFVDDARSFIRKTSATYDLITFGYLDAHRVLSQFSSVRLDNFIYTRESLQEIKKHLNPGGRVVLMYLGFRPWIEETLFSGLREVFKDDVIAVRTTTYKKDDTVIFVAGDGVRKLFWPAGSFFRRDEALSQGREAISDDWPYLYLFKRGIPAHYGFVLLLVLGLALIGLRQVAELRFGRLSGHFFFLGAGFLLLETVSITRFALLFGSTWIVSMIVIMAILVMILLANLIVARLRQQYPGVIYGFLGISILISWLIPIDVYLALPGWISWGVASCVLALPLFFAGVIFSGSLKLSDDVPSALAFNLLGAIVGGACEYLSMAYGFRMLYVLAFGMYLVSWIFLCYKDKNIK